MKNLLALFVVAGLVFFYFQKSLKAPEIEEHRPPAIGTKEIPKLQAIQPRQDHNSSVPREINEEFREELKSAFQVLPTEDTIKKLPEDQVEHFSEPLQRAAVVMGRIARKLKDHPEHRDEISQFYASCAGSTGLIKSVRALCYSDYTALNGSGTNLAVSDDVRDLAAQIP